MCVSSSLIFLVPFKYEFAFDYLCLDPAMDLNYAAWKFLNKDNIPTSNNESNALQHKI